MTSKHQQRHDQTHRRILAAAGTLFREDGYKPTRIDQLMESIGLTVGGFYNHFESKDALLRELVETTTSYAVEGDEPSGPEAAHSIDEFLDMYLTTEHRDNRGNGCLLPCLSEEIARADDEVRTAYTEFINRVVGKMATATESGNGLTKHQRATAIAAMVVGGMLIARAVNDDQVSEQFLKSTRKAANNI